MRLIDEMNVILEADRIDARLAERKRKRLSEPDPHRRGWITRRLGRA